MLSVGLCLSARLPAGLLVFLGFVSSFGSIDHRLQQFELLPCGAIQPLDFFDHIVGVGGCDTLAQLFPAFLGFGVMHHHFNGSILSHGSLTSGHIAITSFLRITGCPLFAAVSARRPLRPKMPLGRRRTKLSGWIHPPFLWSCGSFAYSFSLIYKNAVRGSPRTAFGKGFVWFLLICPRHP